MKKIISFLIICVLVSTNVFAAMSNEELAQYQLKKKEINDQMKVVRDEYKQEMRDLDNLYKEKFRALDKSDKWSVDPWYCLLKTVAPI